MQRISQDPVGAFHQVRRFLQKHVTSAFGTNSVTFEEERQRLLDQNGAFFQEAYVEPLPEYVTGSRVNDLADEDLLRLTKPGIKAFKALVSSGAQ